MLRRALTNQITRQQFRFYRVNRSNTVINFVPQQEAWVVERFGKFHCVLDPGISVLFPIVDKIAYAHNLKEVAQDIPSQTAVTMDNVTVSMDGVLFYRVVDPYKASYGVENYGYAMQQLAQTTMRAEIGHLPLDRIFSERAQLNAKIVQVINDSTVKAWGIESLRYEILEKGDIHLPQSVMQAMQGQATAERKKRASILESEGERQGAINLAQGQRESIILKSEAEKMEQINKAVGEAEAIKAKATAVAQSIQMISEAIKHENAQKAISLLVADKYMDAFSNLAQKGTTLMLPTSVHDPSSMIAQAINIFDTLTTKRKDMKSIEASNEDKKPEPEK
ncbi:stomatin-like protein 2 [Rozella allomycis CSF55]|uniref:Stomatin-like protein 2 n=1 Tax=Rozella allomycis (strain CSF55) TaxID=988480 RepID=A0A4P9YR51_ROZAC|nr:stomatin-like protein 2 [Rozella allomycis CSF55]